MQFVRFLIDVRRLNYLRKAKNLRNYYLQGRLVIAFDYVVEIWSINEPRLLALHEWKHR
jgi:hypothetical protein